MIHNRSHRYRTGLAWFLVAICSIFTATYAQAQFAASACDPQYYETLEARAWLEAQREITQNQNLILKPDSVLEYTCFDLHLNELADHAGNNQTDESDLFSETARWGTNILGTNTATHMDTALNNLVGNAFRQYHQANFQHRLLGGRSGENYTPAGSVQGGDYMCDRMNVVWQEAKCMNFIDDAATDGFFTFLEYRNSSDRRRLPSACTGSVPWGTNINTARNQPAVWQPDNTLTFLERLFPVSGCGDNDSGTNRVRTGLTVRRAKNDPPEYAEFICLAPGCYYNPSRTMCEPSQ